MPDRSDVPVAVLSNRNTLDLAINTWVPGYLARSSPDLDVVIDLVHEDGIIVIDLTEATGAAQLEQLRGRGVTAPIVAVLPAEQVELVCGVEGVVIAHSSQVEDLTAAFELARGQRGASDTPSAAAPAETCDAESEEHSAMDSAAGDDDDVVIDLTGEEPTIRPGWWSRLRSRSAGSAVGDHAEPEALEGAEQVASSDAAPAAVTGPDTELLIDLTDMAAEVEADPTAPVTTMVELGAALRAWALLDELERTIGAGSAVVAIRDSDGQYVIVAGVELAAFEAEAVIPSGHPVLVELTDGPGWYLRTADRPDLSAGLPLAACDELLVVGIPGVHRDVDGVVVIGHFHPFTTTMAAEAARAAADVSRLHRRLAVRWAPGAPVDLAALDPAPSTGGTGAVLPAGSVRAGWALLDRLFPLLAGPSVVMTRTSTGALVTTAAQHVDPDQACQVVAADHPLLALLAEQRGVVALPATGAPRELLRGLPLPRNSHLAAFAVGAADAPGAIVLVSRQREIEAGEREQIVAAIAAQGAAVLVSG